MGLKTYVFGFQKNEPSEYRPITLALNLLMNGLYCDTQLLEKDTRRRLGAEQDFDEICRHKFFASVNWNLLNKRLLTPPVVPDLVRGHFVFFSLGYRGRGKF